MADRITIEQMAGVHEALGGVQKWAHNCHAASHAIVQARIFPAARVARGFVNGLVGQHSWVVVGDNVYSPEWVIDPTLWSYTGRLPQVDYVRGATSRSAGYVPHGAGSIYQSHMPSSQGGDPIELAGDHSPEVENFLRLLGPLDLRGWVKLFHCPVESGWPAREIITAAYRQDIFRAFIPVDIVGNLTDENPGGLYLPTTTKEREESHEHL